MSEDVVKGRRRVRDKSESSVDEPIIFEDDDEYLVMLDEEKNKPGKATKRAAEIVITSSMKKLSLSNHPWEKHYETISGETRSTFAKCTLEHIQNFRKISKNEWKNEKRSENLSKVPRTTERTSNMIPSDPYAFYSVISSRGNVLILTPVFNEVVADDRLDLRLVHLNKHAKDVLNAGTVQHHDHPVGEVLCITKLQRKQKAKEFSIDDFTLKDVTSPDGKHFWEVSEFFVLPRRIVENVLTTPFLKCKGYFECVGSRFGQIIQLRNNLAPRGTKVDTLLMTTVLMPRIHPGQFLFSLKIDDRRKVLKLSPKPLNVKKPSPVAIEAWEAPDSVKKEFKRYQEGFKYFNDEKAYQSLKTVVEHGAVGLYAIKNLDIDPFLYESKIKSYFIKKPYVYLDFLIKGEKVAPPLEKWDRSARIIIQFGAEKLSADVLRARKSGLTIHVMARSFAMAGDEELFETIKKENLIIRQKPESRPRKMKYDVPEDSRADKFIKALYGGQPMMIPDIKSIPPLKFGNFVLLETQTRYVQMMSDARISAVIGTSSFGCGKTVTIAAAALHCANNEEGSIQIVTAVTNSAVVALIEKLQVLNPNARIVRLISPMNQAEIHPDLWTNYDYPEMLDDLLREVLEHEEEYAVSEDLLKQIISFFKRKLFITKNSLNSQKLKHLYDVSDRYCDEDLLHFFVQQKAPNIIVGTIQSIINAFYGNWNSYSKDVATIQIDESSTLTRETFLHTLIRFPEARFSLVGDCRQLAPFCPTDASPLLRKTAIGNVLEDCTRKKLPSVFFNGVFRCRPEMTELLGELFYNSSLVSFHKKSKTEEQLKNFPLQKIHNYPLVFIDTVGLTQESEGTSLKNPEEAKMAMDLADHLLEFVDKSDIAILSFYRGQLNQFYKWTQKTGVYVGSVDSAQGREWPVCIICTTRTTPIANCTFMHENRRVNVALSRSSHLNFVFGRKVSMDTAKNWETIIRRCEVNDTLIKPTYFNRVIKRNSI